MRAALLSLWFEEDAAIPRTKWWKRDAAFDSAITSFLPLTEALIAAPPPAPEPSLSLDDAALADILATDQVPRNAHRGTARAFEGDATALRLARAAVASGVLSRLASEHARLFVLMPFMHSEDPAAHEEVAPLWPDGMTFAHEHAEVVRKFSRFPHRNALLGRESTEEEVAHLASAERKSWEQ